MNALAKFTLIVAAWLLASTTQAQTNTNLQIEGRVAYSRTGASVVLEAEKVCNRSTNARSGTVYMGLWATAGASPIGQGYLVAQTSLSSGSGDTAQLASNTCFTGIRFTTTWTSPPDGVYYLHFYVTEFPNQSGGTGGFRLLDTLTFNGTVTFGNPPPPPPPPPPPATDDHGNTTAAATLLTLGANAVVARLNAILHTAGDIDVFRFVLTARSEVSLQSDSAIDTVGVLLNASGVEITSNDDGVDLDFQIARTLDPGTYYISVRGFDSTAVGPYALLTRVTATSGGPPPPGNTLPVASFTATPASGTAPLAVTFDAFNSSDSDGTIATFSWNFGDTTAAGTGIGTTHTFQNPGTYTVTLTVTDNVGGTGSATRTVTVSAPGGGGGGGGGGAMSLGFVLMLGCAALSRRWRKPDGPLAGSRVLSAMLVCLLAGCAAAPETREIDRFTFVGDLSPRVTSSEAFSGALDNLAANESLVVARARDGGGALSQPTVATVSVVEPVLEAQQNNPDLWLTRCDVDSDGMLDVHCPELFLALKEDELSTRQFVSLQSWYTINANPNVDRDFWGINQVLNRGEAVGREMPVTLKLLTVNLGNKTFIGDMDIYVNIPPNVRLGNIRLASKVVNREGGKEALGMGLMVLGAMVGAYVPPDVADTIMNDYANVESSAVFEVVEVADNRARIKASAIELEPEEGVTVEYDALYEVID